MRKPPDMKVRSFTTRLNQVNRYLLYFLPDRRDQLVEFFPDDDIKKILYHNIVMCWKYAGVRLFLFQHSLRRLLLLACWGSICLLVKNMCSSILWADVEIYFNILLSISTAYYITTITNFINCILSNLVLCLAHHLIYWPDTFNNCFKPVEKILSGSFQ